MKVQLLLNGNCHEVAIRPCQERKMGVALIGAGRRVSPLATIDRHPILRDHDHASAHLSGPDLAPLSSPRSTALGLCAHLPYCPSQSRLCPGTSPQGGYCPTRWRSGRFPRIWLPGVAERVPCKIEPLLTSMLPKEDRELIGRVYALSVTPWLHLFFSKHSRHFQNS